MGIANIINNSTTTSGGEIVRELVNSSDGAGLHFDGSAGSVSFTPVNLGTQFSFEFVVKADELDGGSSKDYLVMYGSGGTFIVGHNDGNLSVFSTGGTSWQSFGANPLSDLKVHHIVVTVDDTSATLYDNGNQIGTATITSPDIDGAGAARLLSNDAGTSGHFAATLYRARSYNKTLTSAEVQTAYERADVDFADQYGSQTDYHTHSNAVSDHSTEANATTGWAANNSPITSQTTVKNVGSYAFKIDYNAGTNAPRASYTFSGKSTGKKYRLQFDYKHSGTGDSVVAGFGHDTYGGVNIVHTITASETSWTTKVYEFEDDGTNYAKFALRIASTSAAATTIYIDNFFLVQIGCVSDYDLAFANPTQSLTVQDRSTNNVDGTASSSTAVSQVQPIIQGNLTSLAVGSAGLPTGVPADNHVFIGDTTTTPLTGADDLIIARGSNDAGVTIRTATTSTGQICFADGNTGNEAYRGFIGYAHGTDNLNLGSGGSTRLTIDSTGNVTANVGTYLKISRDDSYPRLELYRNDASIGNGNTVGDINFGGADANNNAAARIRARADSHWTANSSATAFDFQTCPDGSESPATCLTIASTGDVTVSGPQLEITDDLSGAHTTLKLKNTSATASIGSQIQLHDHDSYFYQTIVDSDLRFYNGAERFQIGSDGVINIPNLSASSDVQTDGSKNLITSSDKRLKNDIGELTAGLDIISNLEPHYFSWKSDETNTQQLGFYAQDVYEFLPEAAPREQKQNLVSPAVAAEPATYYEEGDELPEGKAVGDEKTAAVEAVEAVYEPATNEDGTPDYNWGFNGRPIIAALVAAVKELKAKVETLENA